VVGIFRQQAESTTSPDALVACRRLMMNDRPEVILVVGTVADVRRVSIGIGGVVRAAGVYRRAMTREPVGEGVQYRGITDSCSVMLAWRNHARHFDG